MTRQTVQPILTALLLAGVGVVLFRALWAQQAVAAAPLAGAPGPNYRFITRFTVVDAPERFEQVLMVIDFPPRTWTPLHRTGGSIYNTVVDGEISTRREGGHQSEMTYQADDAFVESGGDWLEIGNSADANARVIATALLPEGAPLTVDQHGFSTSAYSYFGAGYRGLDTAARPLVPTIVHRSSIVVDRAASTMVLLQSLAEFEPGIWTPRHVHGGQEFALVASGEVTLERGGGSDVFGAGAAWVNAPGLNHAEGNAGEVPARVAASLLLPEGAPPTTLRRD